MEGRRPPPTSEEYAEFFEYLDRTFPHGGASPKPKSEPPAEPQRELTPEEIQQRLKMSFSPVCLRGPSRLRLPADPSRRRLRKFNSV